MNTLEYDFRCILLMHVVSEGHPEQWSDIRITVQMDSSKGCAGHVTDAGAAPRLQESLAHMLARLRPNAASNAFRRRRSRERE